MPTPLDPSMSYLVSESNERTSDQAQESERTTYNSPDQQHQICYLLHIIYNFYELYQ